MTATLERRESVSVWERFSALITSTENRLYRLVWLFNVPTLLTATCYIIASSQLLQLISMVSVSQ
jgi:photosystem II P680 reaction center D1 protein